MPERDAARGGETVDFMDAAYVHWRVSERDARDDPGAQGEWCLIFSSIDAVRRVWAYPDAWRELSREALMALSWGR